MRSASNKRPDGRGGVRSRDNENFSDWYINKFFLGTRARRATLIILTLDITKCPLALILTWRQAILSTLSAYHLFGKPGNTGKNSNETVHPGGNFSGKKGIPFEVLPFSRSYREDRIFCTACLDYQCQASCWEKVKNLLVFCKWYNSIPSLFSVPKKIAVPFDGNFSPKFPSKC